MKYIKLLLALLLVAPLTITPAQDAALFEWTPPLVNTNGTPLTDAEISSYNVYCNSTLLSSVLNTGGVDQWTSPVLPAGSYDCNATVVNTAGTEGPASDTVNFIVDPSVPGAPTNFTVSFP